MSASPVLAPQPAAAAAPSSGGVPWALLRAEVKLLAEVSAAGFTHELRVYCGSREVAYGYDRSHAACAARLEHAGFRPTDSAGRTWESLSPMVLPRVSSTGEG